MKLHLHNAIKIFFSSVSSLIAQILISLVNIFVTYASILYNLKTVIYSEIFRLCYCYNIWMKYFILI